MCVYILTHNIYTQSFQSLAFLLTCPALWDQAIIYDQRLIALWVAQPEEVFTLYPPFWPKGRGMHDCHSYRKPT